MEGEEPEAGKQSKLEKFPCDIFHNIFSRLQLKFVIRASCVSKSWRNLIKDQAFVKLYTSQSKPEPSLINLTRRSIGKKHVISISPLKHNGHVLAANETPIDHMVSPLSWEFVGTCDGLLCFVSFGEEEVAMICNPITREHVILPTRASTSCKPEFAFGFDLTAKKYKIVRFDKSTSHLRAEVYTLGGGDESWREVQCDNFPLSGKPVYANGVVYWLVRNLNERIVSFDLGGERLESTPHPHFGGQIRLAELGGCLSVVDLSPGDLVEVWVMKGCVAANRRWEMEYIIPVSRPNWRELQQLPRLICVHELNGVLIVWLRDTWSYEKKAFRIRDVKIKDFPIWLDWEICSGYRGSLVPLGDIHSTVEDYRVDLVRFVSDVELHSLLLAEGGDLGEQKPSGACDRLVASFHENGLLI